MAFNEKDTSFVSLLCLALVPVYCIAQEDVTITIEPRYQVVHLGEAANITCYPFAVGRVALTDVVLVDNEGNSLVGPRVTRQSVSIESARQDLYGAKFSLLSAQFIDSGVRVRCIIRSSPYVSNYSLLHVYSCPPLPPFIGGRIHLVNRGGLIWAYYVCNKDYISISYDGNVRVCRNNTDYWTSTPKRCTKLLDCGPAPIIRNGLFRYVRPSSQATFVGGSVRYQCNRGYRRIGPLEIECLYNGTWSKEPFCSRCSLNEELSPSLIVEYRYEDELLRANYLCSDNFVLEGSRSLTCYGNGSWSGLIPTCHRLCGPPPPKQNVGVRVASNGTFQNSVAVYSCEQSYYKWGNLTVRCSGGNWIPNGTVIICNRCKRLHSPENGTVSFSIAGSDVTATHSCLSGFVLRGAAVRHCEASVGWNSSSPVCQLIVSKKSRSSNIGGQLAMRLLFSIMIRHVLCTASYMSGK